MIFANVLNIVLTVYSTANDKPVDMGDLILNEEVESCLQFSYK